MVCCGCCGCLGVCGGTVGGMMGPLRGARGDAGARASAGLRDDPRDESREQLESEGWMASTSVTLGGRSGLSLALVCCAKGVRESSLDF